MLKERRAARRIREELLDNKHTLSRLPGNLDELLSLKFHAWSSNQSTLLEQDDPAPHINASAAYRELYGLCQGRVGEAMGEQHTYGDPPTDAERSAAATAIDLAVETLVEAATDDQKN
jgi:hypothetical protein